MSKPAKHVLRYLAGSVVCPITYKQGGLELATDTNANWGVNPNNGKSTLSYIVMLANEPISSKVELQSLIVQSTMEAELMAAAIAMKELLFCSNLMMKLGCLKMGFKQGRSGLHR